MIEFPGEFPLRTLVVCFTLWLITTEAFVFDQIKFNTRTDLLEQATRSKRRKNANVVNLTTRNSPAMASNVFAATVGFLTFGNARRGK